MASFDASRCEVALKSGDCNATVIVRVQLVGPFPYPQGISQGVNICDTDTGKGHLFSHPQAVWISGLGALIQFIGEMEAQSGAKVQTRAGTVGRCVCAVLSHKSTGRAN